MNHKIKSPTTLNTFFWWCGRSANFRHASIHALHALQCSLVNFYFCGERWSRWIIGLALSCLICSPLTVLYIAVKVCNIIQWIIVPGNFPVSWGYLTLNLYKKKRQINVQYTRLHIRYVSSNSCNRGSNGTSSINVLLYNSYEDGFTSYQILDKDTPDTMMLLIYDMFLFLSWLLLENIILLCIIVDELDR